ncbi:MAG: peptidoglycan-binding protein [Candidatus Eisenbacteria bacterium]|nr:peptidoglycan-binding protein [Candidatus Eisenbacteria bacterium]
MGRCRSRSGPKGVRTGAIDGIYGPQTAAAMQVFQIREGVAVDGEVGPSVRRP